MRRRKLKVLRMAAFLVGVLGQRHVIAAVHNRKQFATLVGCSVHEVARYASETKNDEDVAKAMTKPGTLFYGPPGCVHERVYTEYWRPR